MGLGCRSLGSIGHVLRESKARVCGLCFVWVGGLGGWVVAAGAFDEREWLGPFVLDLGKTS